MLVERLSNDEEWERFVADSSGGTFFHTLKWKKILEEAFSLEAEYLAIRDEAGKLAGVCPFAVTSKLRLFRILDSLPESDFGGPLTVEPETPAVLKALNDYLPEVCREKNITYAKIRCPSETTGRHFNTRGMTTDTASGSMNLNLEQHPSDFIWDEVFTQKDGQRTYIRRFEKDGFRNIEAQSIKDLDTFYELYYRNMNYIGGAVHPYSFFRKLWDELHPEHFNIILTVGNGRCIGGEGFFLYRPRKTVYQTFIGLDRNVETQYRTYFYLSWGLLKWCEANGFKTVSFGGTPADPKSANYSQKSKFGANFNQDYVVCLPFKRSRFLVREATLKLGRLIQKRLPPALRSKVQKAGFGI
ncbi:MAG: GNAT family N-acetyltransferase [Pseudomonadota bacterium]